MVSLATPYPQWKNLLASGSGVSMTPSTVQILLQTCNMEGMRSYTAFLITIIIITTTTIVLPSPLSCSKPAHRIHTNTM